MKGFYLMKVFAKLKIFSFLFRVGDGIDFEWELLLIGCLGN
jgi:hypothetical protein